jgi:bacterioferritin
VVAEPTEKIHEAQAMLVKAKAMEESSAKFYNQAALECAQNADSASRKVFEELVAAEERHWDEFDRQGDFIERFGERYLALQSFQPEGGAGEAGPA